MGCQNGERIGLIELDVKGTPRTDAIASTPPTPQPQPTQTPTTVTQDSNADDDIPVAEVSVGYSYAKVDAFFDRVSSNAWNADLHIPVNRRFGIAANPKSSTSQFAME